ncbi:unnamed protein product [Heligmosomoides polygyrus]|uniref:Lipase_GDSL domain-containing protein n=1 Tax=Heligmosomoides polygyrus TaxID=6339 RepID=A0A183GDT7_HELPZ|nr:unnamed protein product [Heligmosomoides polygyrus]
MQWKLPLAVDLLLFLVIPAGQAVIRPPEDGSIVEAARRIIGNFEDWNWKRDQYLRFTRDYPFGWPTFDCPRPNVATEPTDVHHLAPWHISVIGAIGDSLTAGRSAGAETFEDVFLDYRGLSFATGGQNNISTQATLASIFRYFSPDLEQVSSGTGTSDDVHVAGFNLAESGAFSSDLLRQAEELVQRIKASTEVDFDNDWKFISVFIGSNDLCHICNNETDLGAEQYGENLRQTILYLKENLPRTYVNLVPPFHVEVLLETQTDNPFCVDMQRLFCPCLFELPKQNYLEVKRSFDGTLETFRNPQFQTDGFALTISSGVNNSLNLAFIALDCFHFSQMAHDVMAKIIWGDLFKPVASRAPADLDTFQPQLWSCPPQDCPYLVTRSTSKNCSGHTDVKTLTAKHVQIIYDRTVYLPSMDELERRAFMEEHGPVFFLIVFGVLLLVLVTCVVVMRSCRSRPPPPFYPSERTRLLSTKYDQLMF